MLPSPEVPMIPPKLSTSTPNYDFTTTPSNQPRLHGFPLFFQQLSGLLKKNFLLSLRNRRATFLQLASSIFFVFLIFSVDQALNSRRKVTSAFRNVYNPEAELVPAIRACETGYYIKTPCFDFIWSAGNDSGTITKAQTIVENIMSKNPGRTITPDKVKKFTNINDANDWLLKNPMKTTGALHFQEREPGVIAYGIQTNSTPKFERGIFEDPTFTFQIPLQVAVEREITRFLTQDSTIEWSVAFKEFAHPNIETSSVVGIVGPIFLLAATMFGLVIQMSSIVTEKELKLRQAMSLMGLMDSAFWLSWLLWEVLLVFISSMLIVLFGMMFQFDFFLNNSFGILFFLFFLFQFNMTGFAFMLSTLISSSASARTVGFGVFIIGFLTSLVTTTGGFPYSSKFANYVQSIWSIFPPNLLAIGMQSLGNATATKQAKGISWADRTRCSAVDPDCVITMAEIYRWLTSTFFIWFFLALYFDNVIKDVNGVRKSWYYFLVPSYWTGRASSRAAGGNNVLPLEGMPTDEDVLEEERFVKEHTSINDPNIAVKVCGLVKIFPGTRGCCKCKTTPAYHAIKNLWVHMEKDKLFCLLGPNGAGKTTTINCLTGVIPVTKGDASIYGNSIRSPQGISNIRSIMGVCPQFDVLWDALSGLEHLCLFARMKGLPSSLENKIAMELLSQVKLEKDKDLRVGSYSGGMKRRLSVAIALIGDPKIVYLDEPTTGMDPISRRHVWDIIEGAKKGRAIILTTHSMEEADVLSDRISIMAKGQLRCIGTSLYLKSKFGAGYIVSVSLNKQNDVKPSAPGMKSRAEFVNEFFFEKLGVNPSEENAAVITYIVPREKESQMSGFFERLQDRKEKLGIADVQISLTTLDEVFLNIAKQAELESAADEGRFETVDLPNGVSIQVPIGASSVMIPGSETEQHPRGMMIRLEWQQDESGRLCLARQSNLMPTPPIEHVDAIASMANKGRGKPLKFTRIFSSERQITQ